MPPQILLVDDDRLITSYYVSALANRGFSVSHFLSPDEFFNFLEKQKPSIDVVVLDVMMPPGNRYESVSTKEGLQTGVWLYRDFREMYPDVPVIILTNVTNSATLSLFNEDSNLCILQKLKVPPNELAEAIESIAPSQLTN